MLVDLVLVASLGGKGGIDLTSTIEYNLGDIGGDVVDGDVDVDSLDSCCDFGYCGGHTCIVDEDVGISARSTSGDIADDIAGGAVADLLGAGEAGVSFQDEAGLACLAGNVCEAGSAPD